MFGTEEGYHAALRALIDDGEIWDIPAVSDSGEGIRYTKNNELYTLNITF